MGKSIEVRCPNERKHFVKGVEYETCGIFLGAVEENSGAYFRCPMCGLIHVSNEEEGLKFHIVGKDKVEFSKHWGIVE